MACCYSIANAKTTENMWSSTPQKQNDSQQTWKSKVHHIKRNSCQNTHHNANTCTAINMHCNKNNYWKKLEILMGRKLVRYTLPCKQHACAFWQRFSAHKFWNVLNLVHYWKQMQCANRTSHRDTSRTTVRPCHTTSNPSLYMVRDRALQTELRRCSTLFQNR